MTARCDSGCSGLSSPGCSRSFVHGVDVSPRAKSSPYRLWARSCHGRAESGLCPAGSQISLLCDCERIVKFDAQISSCTFDLRMAEQELHSPQIACALIDKRRLSTK